MCTYVYVAVCVRTHESDEGDDDLDLDEVKGEKGEREEEEEEEDAVEIACSYVASVVRHCCFCVMIHRVTKLDFVANVVRYVEATRDLC